MAKRSSSPIRTRQVSSLIDLDMVLQIHERLTAEFAETEDPISPPGVRDAALLESAVGRQSTGIGGVLKYATTHESAAALLYGICNNHAFHNGNKRTALVAALVHLDANGQVLEGVTKEDLFRLMRRVADHHFSRFEVDGAKQPDSDYEVAQIAQWIRQNSRAIQRGDRPISYRELYEILDGFGYRLGEKKHNYVEVLALRKTWLGREKWVCVNKAPCPGDARMVPLPELKRLRHELALDAENGVDSYSFYGTRTVIDGFIVAHRSVLRRLAKT